MHDDRLGGAQLPGRVASIGTNQVGDLVPERHMVAPPVLRIGETLPFIPGHVVPDEVQGHDPHTGRLNDAVRSAVVIRQRQALAYSRQRIAGQVLDRERGRRGLLTAQHRGQKPIAQAPIAVIPEAQRLAQGSSRVLES